MNEPDPDIDSNGPPDTDVNNNVEAEEEEVYERGNGFMNFQNARYIVQIFQPPLPAGYTHNSLHNAFIRGVLMRLRRWKKVQQLLTVLFFTLGMFLVTFPFLVHLHLSLEDDQCFAHLKRDLPPDGIFRVVLGSEHTERPATTSLRLSLGEIFSKSSNFQLPMTKQLQRMWFENELKFPFLSSITLPVSPNGTEHLVDEIVAQAEHQQLLKHPFEYYTELMVFDFAKDYGLLRLSDELKARYNVNTVAKFVSTTNRTCFGGPFMQKLVKNFVGFDRLVLRMFTSFLDDEHDKAYLKSSVGPHYYQLSIESPSSRSIVSSLVGALLLTLLFPAIIILVWRTITVQATAVFKYFVIALDNPAQLSRALYLNLSSVVLVFSVIGIENVNRVILPRVENQLCILLAIVVADQFYSIIPVLPVRKLFAALFFSYFYLFAFYTVHFDSFFVDSMSGGVMLLTFSTILFIFHCCSSIIPIFQERAHFWNVWNDQDRAPDVLDHLYAFELWERVPEDTVTPNTTTQAPNR